MENRIDADSNWQDEIERLQREGVAAFVARDLETLGRMFADELVINSPLNRVTDKRTVLDLLGRGIIGHTTYDEHIEAVRRLGDLVTVMGADVVTNRPDDKPVGRRFTNVWRSKNGGWELIIRHATVIGAA